MNRKILLLVLLQLSAIQMFFIDANSLWYVTPDNKSYIDINGLYLELPEFDTDEYKAFDFVNGLSIVQFEDGLYKNKNGYIKEDGSWFLRPLYLSGDFHNGYATVRIPQGDSLFSGGLYGYLKRNGEWFIEPILWSNEGFSEGRAVLYEDQDDNGTVIDTEGNIIFKAPEPMGINAFSDGMAMIMPLEAGRRDMGFINLDGEIVIPTIHHNATDFTEGVSVVNKNRFINKKGEMILEEVDVTWADGFYDGLCRVIKNGRIGFIDHSGEMVIEPQFTNVTRFVDGIAAASTDPSSVEFIFGPDIVDFNAEHVPEALWGFIDKNGEWIIEPQFSFIFRPIRSGGVSEVQKKFSDGTGCIQLIVVHDGGRVIWDSRAD